MFHAVCSQLVTVFQLNIPEVSIEKKVYFHRINLLQIKGCA